jgi:hypothetical protein
MKILIDMKGDGAMTAVECASIEVPESITIEHRRAEGYSPEDYLVIRELGLNYSTHVKEQQ